jgi:hypothetical protein
VASGMVQVWAVLWKNAKRSLLLWIMCAYLGLDR